MKRRGTRENDRRSVVTEGPLTSFTHHSPLGPKGVASRGSLTPFTAAPPGMEGVREPRERCRRDTSRTVLRSSSSLRTSRRSPRGPAEGLPLRGPTGLRRVCGEYREGTERNSSLTASRRQGTFLDVGQHDINLVSLAS